MATYLYHCDNCGVDREVEHRLSERPEVVCETISCVCAPMRRLIAGGTRFILLGGNWSHDGYTGGK